MNSMWNIEEQKKLTPEQRISLNLDYSYWTLRVVDAVTVTVSARDCTYTLKWDGSFWN